MPTHPPQRCAECDAPLARDQRYCLSCGVRCGLRAPAMERILAGLRSDGRAPRSDGRAPRSDGRTPLSGSPAVRRAREGRVLGLPYPTAAVLTLAMLAFGTVTGTAASNPAGALNALRRGPLTLLIPAPAPTASTLLAAPPPVEAAPTPEATPPPTESTPASEEPAPSSGGGHKQSGAPFGSSGSGSGPHLPPVEHVFLIVLADEPYALTFGPESPAPYIAHTLEHRGELLTRFYAVAHEELADEIALISGLGPTPQTASDCPVFDDILPAVAGSDGQYGGQGCIYPKEAQTVGDQLAAKKLSWRVYAEGMGDGAAAGATGALKACEHPEFGAADPTSQTPEGDTYATFRDPFTYFDGVLHSPDCAREDTGIEGLARDLASAKRTPTLSYIVPDLCHDGRPTPCAPGAQSGLPAAEVFLRRVVPEILASPAYRHGGLLILTTDQAPTTGEYADSSACCKQPRLAAPLASPTGSTPAGEPAGDSSGSGSPGSGSPGSGSTAPAGSASPVAGTPSTGPAAGTPSTNPAAPGPSTTTPTTTPADTAPPTGTPTAPATTTPTAPTPSTTTPAASPSPGVKLPPTGGGQVGALLLSPYVKPDTFDQEESFNDFSLLRTIENIFGLPHLGYAATRGLSSLEASVFSAWSAPASSS
jgi:phosphatidylinositol-3-phosphatase